MQVVTRAALMRKVTRNVRQQGIVVSCRSVTLGPVPGMSQSCLPAVCGGVHSFSFSQGPGGSWILFSVSPWWKSKSIRLVLSGCAWAISVIEREQHPQAAVFSALACSADCTWPRLRAHPSGIQKLQCITSYYVRLSGRRKMFICIVLTDCVDLWGELIVRGILCILGGLESSAAVMACWLPCFPVSQAGESQAGLYGCVGWRVVGNTVALPILLYDPGGGSKTSKETASQRLHVHRTTSLVHLLCLCLLCFSNKPHKVSRSQVTSQLVSVFVWLLTSVQLPAGLRFHICGVHTCVESDELILPVQKRTGAEQGFYKQPMHLYWNQAIKNWAILL